MFEINPKAQQDADFDVAAYKARLVDILKAFDALCRKEGLRYSMVSGTLLGAVRHRGFIPWDDDIDIVMPRPDYKRLLQMGTQSAIPSPYRLISPYTAKHYAYPFAKILDTRTLLLEFPRQRRQPLGAYIDIFPLDGLPADADKRAEQCARIARHTRRARNIETQFYDLRGHVKQALYTLLYNSQREWLAADCIAQEYPFDSAEEVACHYGTYGDREVLPRTLFDEYVDLPFEGLQVQATKDYAFYLHRFFGDYMQLPPAEQQRSHHTHYLYTIRN